MRKFKGILQNSKKFYKIQGNPTKFKGINWKSWESKRMQRNPKEFIKILRNPRNSYGFFPENYFFIFTKLCYIHFFVFLNSFYS